MAKAKAVVKGLKNLGELLGGTQAERMARAAEQGFDLSRPVYYGSKSDIGEFKTTGLKRTSAGGQSNKGKISTSTDPEIASRYAESIAIGKGLPKNAPWHEIEQYFRDLGMDYVADHINRFGFNPVIHGASDPVGGNVIKAVVRGDIKAVDAVDFLPSGPNGFRMFTQAENAAMADGFAGVKFDNVPNWFPDDKDKLTIFDPANIRSVNADFNPANRDSANLLAGIQSAAPIGGAALLAGAALAPEEAEAGVITKGGKRLIEAWHGSPHSFDKFDISKIGTGEGAQAYGHGLYFADAEGTAKEYRDALSDWMPKGESIVPGSPESQAAAWVAEALDAQSSNPYARAMEAARKVLPDDQIKQVENVLARWEAQGAEFKKGNLYRTHIDVDPDTLLDWDKPLSEQSEAVRSAVSDYARANPQDSRASEFFAAAEGIAPSLDRKASAFYSDVAGQRTGNEAQASQYFRDMGIPGIRYRDQMSRGNQWIVRTPNGDAKFSTRGEADAWMKDTWQGDSSATLIEPDDTYNYVMFDDKPISIVERGNASPELLAGTATATAAAIGADQYLRDQSEAQSAAQSFAQRRASKAGFWKQMREELVGFAEKLPQVSPMTTLAAGYAASLPGERMMTEADIPLRSLYAGSGALVDAAQGDSLRDIGANAQRAMYQGSDQTAFDMGGQVVDALSPYVPGPVAAGAGVAANVIPQILSPF